jgi:predicted transcriptional regulator
MSVLSFLESRLKILKEVDRGMKKGDVARKYGLSPSTLSAYVKDRDKTRRTLIPMQLDHRG